jgi:hypothetical protein
MEREREREREREEGQRRGVRGRGPWRRGRERELERVSLLGVITGNRVTEATI